MCLHARRTTYSTWRVSSATTQRPAKKATRRKWKSFRVSSSVLCRMYTTAPTLPQAPICSGIWSSRSFSCIRTCATGLKSSSLPIAFFLPLGMDAHERESKRERQREREREPTHAHMQTHTHTHTHTHIHIHIHTHAHMHTCTHAHMHTCMHAFTHTG